MLLDFIYFIIQIIKLQFVIKENQKNYFEWVISCFVLCFFWVKDAKTIWYVFVKFSKRSKKVIHTNTNTKLQKKFWREEFWRIR